MTHKGGSSGGGNKPKPKPPKRKKRPGRAVATPSFEIARRLTGGSKGRSSFENARRLTRESSQRNVTRRGARPVAVSSGTGQNFTPANANFSSISGASQLVDPSGNVIAGPASFEGAGAARPVTGSVSRRFADIGLPLQAGLEGFGTGGSTFGNRLAEIREDFVFLDNEKLDTLALGIIPGPGTLAKLGGLIKGATTATKVSKTAQVGKLTSATVDATSTAGSTATNSATTATTTSWLSKLARAARNPTLVASTLVAAIGSYPFAGFIKEEALQTLGFGVNSAIRNEDLDGAQRALDFQGEILEPGLWSEMMSKIPYVNVLDSLNDFYSAATIKNDIDQRIINDLREKEESGETEAEYFERIRQEQEIRRQEQRVADEQYYAEVRRNLAEARRLQREEDAKYWADIMAQREEEAERRRKEEEDYWSAYFRELNKIRLQREEDRPSKLNFGLL